MGRKNPDRLPIRAWVDRARTVEAMRDNGWEVLSVCGVCHLTMQVDLAAVAKVRPGAILWNATPPCRRLGCQGRVRFLGRVPGRDLPHELLVAEQERGV